MDIAAKRAELVRQAGDAATDRDLDRVVDLLTTALEIGPPEAELYHLRGVALRRMARHSAALVDFDRALKLKRRATSYEQRGLVYAALGDTSAATSDWEAALLLAPTSSPALVNLGWLRHLAGDQQAALLLLSSAIEHEPTHAGAYVNRAEVLAAMNDRAAAFADLRRADRLISSGQDTSAADSWWPADGDDRE